MDRNGDRLALLLDAEPDGNKFDLEVRSHSPANGVIPALLGWKRSMDLTVTGDGTWKAWKGVAALNMSERPTARLQLSVENGKYGLRGALAPAPFLTGKLQRLTAPRVKVAGDGTACRPRLQRSADCGIAGAASGRDRLHRPCRGKLSRAPARDRPAAPASALPEHDRAERPHAVDA